MSLLVTLIFGAFWLNHNVISAAKDYDGYKVYNLTLDTAAKVNFAMQYDGTEGYDFWLSPKHGLTQLMVSPRRQSTFESAMKLNNIAYSILQSNVGQWIQRERESQSAESEVAVRLSSNDEFHFDHIPRYREIVSFMKSLIVGKKFCKLVMIGVSYEGRPIHAVEVKKSPDNPVFVIDAGIHAREWAAPVSAMYILKRLVDGEDEFAERMTFVVIPSLNPDGYEFSHEEDRLWRKNRSARNDTQCRGVDLNRNFDSHWGEVRADTDPCSDIFQGEKPFSEPESEALRDTILKYRPVAYLTLHSYGAYLLYPWGYSKDRPPNWKTLDKIAKRAVESIRQVHGTNYTYGSSGGIFFRISIDEASGASDDWTMEQGASIVYTMELPQYGRYFVVPNEKITQLVTETYAGFASMVESIVNQ